MTDDEKDEKPNAKSESSGEKGKLKEFVTKPPPEPKPEPQKKDSD
ncbi:MAG: hypothetical protein ACLPY5_15775 [Candidatus Bathyarchaeia archaeon]